MWPAVPVSHGAGVSMTPEVTAGVGLGLCGPPEAITPQTPPMTATAATAIAKKCHLCHPLRAAFVTGRF